MKLDKMLQIAGIEKELVKESKYGKLLNESLLERDKLQNEINSLVEELHYLAQTYDRHQDSELNEDIVVVKNLLERAAVKRALQRLHLLRHRMMQKNKNIREIQKFSDMIDRVNDLVKRFGRYDQEPDKVSAHVDRPHNFKNNFAREIEEK